MRIKRFELCNVGVFGGTHSFDLLLRSNDQRPRSIILFGGKNGSGKTTLLDGFRLCLYGRLALGAQVRKKQYEDYLRELLTRGVDGSKCENAYLRLEFDYGTMGETNDYIIMRSWRRKQDDSLDEHLEVFKDGRPLEHLDPSYWDDLVAELVPLGLSDLFFFDGERIQRLAEEDDHLVFFASVKSLLGLDLIDRLETDLDIFKDKQIREQVGVGDSCRIDELDRQVAEKNERLLRSQLERAELQTRLDAAHCSLKELETKFTHLGGKLARDRGELATRKALIHAEISMTEKRIRELTDGCFPFALCPSLTHDLLCQFGVEEQLLKNEGVRKTFENVLSSVEKRLSGEKVPGSKSPQKLLSILREEIERQTANFAGEGIHEYSKGLHDRLIRWFGQAERESNTLRELCQVLERHTRDLCELEQRLKQIPDEEHLKSAFDGLGEKHKEVASLEQELLTKDQEISLLQGEISRLVREKEKQRESIDRSAQANGRLQLVENCGKALAEYKLQLIRLKVKTLEREITGCLKKLMRKEDLVHHVEIDPENFVIRLFDSRGQELLKKELSAGEKQMYAVAVLWGLACASGRNMPIIIDTPLGRLDSEHRRLLIENYFPHVSHQTIILSTDTEIDRLLFNALGKNISHAYHLVYDAASGLVKPENGYFWEQEVAYA